MMRLTTRRVHDALNTIGPRYTTYLSGASFAGGVGSPSEPLDPAALTAWTARQVLVSEYPGQSQAADSLLSRWTEGGRSGASGSPEAILAARVAGAVLSERDGDGWNGEASYEWHPMGPGVYAEFNEHSGTPEGFVFGAGWGAARPFVLSGPDELRSPPLLGSTAMPTWRPSTR